MKTIITILAIILSFATAKTTFAYDYNGIEYKLAVPENIEYLEYCYNTGNCELTNRQEKIIKLNVLLIKKGLQPIY